MRGMLYLLNHSTNQEKRTYLVHFHFQLLSGTDFTEVVWEGKEAGVVEVHFDPKLSTKQLGVVEQIWFHALGAGPLAQMLANEVDDPAVWT